MNLNQGIRVFKGKKREGKKTLKACVSLLLDISQSDSMVSGTAMILIGWISKQLILIHWSIPGKSMKPSLRAVL